MMSSIATSQALRHQLAIWSDEVVEDAASLVDGYRDLLEKRITNAQLHGLMNVADAAPSFAVINAFIENQADKADRASRSDTAHYWRTVGQALEKLRGEARRQWRKVYGEDPDETRLDDWHCRLVREYVQHLVAHSQWARLGKDKFDPNLGN